MELWQQLTGDNLFSDHFTSCTAPPPSLHWSIFLFACIDVTYHRHLSPFTTINKRWTSVNISFPCHMFFFHNIEQLSRFASGEEQKRRNDVPEYIIKNISRSSAWYHLGSRSSGSTSCIQWIKNKLPRKRNDENDDKNGAKDVWSLIRHEQSSSSSWGMASAAEFSFLCLLISFLLLLVWTWAGI